MGHRHDDAVEALRAFAADLERSALDGAVRRAGRAHQDDAPALGPGFGAPHLELIVGVAGVVLVGLVGAAAFFGLATRPDVVAAPDASTSSTAVIAADQTTDPTSIIVPQADTGSLAVRAVLRLTAAGMTDAASMVEQAISTGTDTDPDVAAAIDGLMAALDVAAGTEAGELYADPDVRTAVVALFALTTPPGLDPDWTPPGLDDGSLPPGQDPDFTPPGQDPDFTPPGQDDDFTPPGQDDDFTPPGQDGGSTPPGQSERGNGSDG